MSQKHKHKKLMKNSWDLTGLIGKREKVGSTKSTGEPDAVKWFFKTVSTDRRTIFIFAIYFMFRKLSAFAWEQKNALSTGAWSRATQAFCRFSTPTSVEFESSVSSKKVRAEVAIKFSNFGQNFPTAAKLSNFRRNFLPYIRNLLATRSIIDPYYFIFQQLSSTNA